MKKRNVLIAIGILGLCAVGWLTAGSQMTNQSSLYSAYIDQADAWVDRGLYQRAIGSYNLALAEQETEEVYLRLNNAYNLRYEEAPGETFDDYMDFLAAAVAAYPGNQELVDKYVAFCSAESKYEAIYNCLTRAIANGYDTQEIRAELTNARYAFQLRRSEFSGLKQFSDDCYCVKTSSGWNAYSTEDGYLLASSYAYISGVSEAGLVVVTGNDSRLLDTTGMVYGIFDGEVTDASLFSENLVAACIGGVYSYYDEFADKQFGGFEKASSFQNGKAAVKKDGKWILINAKGEAVSDEFEEIVLDDAGRFLVNGMFIAKLDGQYGLYNEDLKQLCILDYADIDRLTDDGAIAVAQNGKWGFVDSDGEVLINFVYDEAKSFSNGLAAVKQGNLWGFIDTAGNLVIEYQFSDAGYMSANGICPVRTDFLEDCVNSGDGEDTDMEKSAETWKLLQLIIGIKEN